MYEKQESDTKSGGDGGVDPFSFYDVEIIDGHYLTPSDKGYFGTQTYKMLPKEKKMELLTKAAVPDPNADVPMNT